MNIKRTLASILTCVMVATGFTACSSSPTPGASQATSAPEATSKTADPTTPKTAQEPTDNKIIIFQNSGIVQSSGKAGSNAEDLAAVKQYILDATGIEIEVIIPPTGEENTKLDAMLAMQEPIDLFWGEWSKYANQGAIQPLTTQISESGQAIVSAWGEENMSQVTGNDGQIWGVPRLAPLAVYPVFVRTDWLEKIGKPAPTTIDELEEVLRLFKETDPAGNGTTIPLLTTKGLLGEGDNGKELSMTLAAGFMGEGYGYYLDPSDSLVKPGVLHPGYKDFVQKMADWYAKGYLFKESFVTDKNTARQLVKQGVVGASAMWYSTITMQAPYAAQANPDVDYTLCSITGPKGKAETVSEKSIKAALVPSYSKKADLVVKYLNWLHEDVENHIITVSGMKDVNWKYVDEQTHEVEALNQNYIGDFTAGQGIANEQKFFFSDPIKKMHSDYIRNEITKLDRAMKPSTFDVVFDKAELSKAVVNLEDINRMEEEEVLKFIIGVRPMAEYDSFIEQLYQIGIDKQITELTRQYNAAK